jgi:hypothetical protein
VLGAWITLLALAIDPFTQQIIRPVMCNIALIGTPGKVPRATNLTSTDDATYDTQGLEMSMLASIYSTLVEGDKPIDVQCLTGNCTFTQELNPEISYQTLGFDSACVDVSKEVKAETKDRRDTWYIPRTVTNSTIRSANPADYAYQELSANVLYRFFSASRLLATMGEPGVIQFPEYWTTKQTETPLVSFTAMMFNVDRSNCERTFCQTSTDMPLAVECKIWPVILTIKSRVQSTKLLETIVRSEPLGSTWIGSGRSFSSWLRIPAQVLRDGAWESCSGSEVETPDKPVAVGATNVGNLYLYYDYYGGSSPRENAVWYAQDCVWIIDGPAYSGLYGLFTRMFQNQTLVNNALETSGEPWLKSLYHKGQSNFSTVEAYASQIARAMTKQTRLIRSFRDEHYGFAKGTVMKTETCVQVRWAWIIFPASLIAFTIIFLAITIWKTGRSGGRDQRYGIWKSSSLAVLLGGLQEEARGSGALERKSDMERRAKDMEVSLRPVDGGWRLG